MGVYFSHWIVLMFIFLTLLIVSARIRNKVGYNLIFMNQVITILASMTIVCYMMYTVSPDVIERFHSRYLYITNIFVIVGIIRYLQVVTGTGSWADSSPRQPVPRGRSPERSLHPTMYHWFGNNFLPSSLSGGEQ